MLRLEVVQLVVSRLLLLSEAAVRFPGQVHLVLRKADQRSFADDARTNRDEGGREESIALADGLLELIQLVRLLDR